ncbi:multiple sugar ABC transporter, ATP-binding protein [Halarchaeum acidiphilum MH1-52-1]|uniref:ABC-type D-xylose/L-arabinose transporter n=1 Tax=Halarchaeum acidiphilum MH1-52-1 TaxID=1261545 RepID=U3ADL4_9EURY|nr:ABC transporter ATP-binding protein [Halarchaeum acidiphilum]GAD52858.1 multiple sugar ABC transporter, ATP-binding protein [Halarchaeum acidiphilum MH1-52-1]
MSETDTTPQTETESNEDYNVRIDEFTKVYDSGGNGVVAVEDLNIDIRRGEFLVFVGPSGCGKTTTLRTVAGLETATEGRIWIEGEDVTGMDPRERGIAMVFQNYALYPHMTVRENMSFPLRIRNYPSDEIGSRVDEAAGLLSIDDLLERKPSELSGGQQQRVALGRAIVREPSVFLMDEPLSNLDAKLRVQMRTELNEIHQRVGKTTIYVTHDQAEAMTLGDRVAVLNDGKLQQIGPPQHLYDNPTNQFVAGFIGEPPMNFIDVDVVPDGNGHRIVSEDLFDLKLPERHSKALAAVEPDSVTFGIRPEDLHDAADAGAPDGETFEAEPKVIEPMGSDKFLTLTSPADGAEFSARVVPESDAAVGEPITLVPNMGKSHLFDNANGRTLTARE